MDLLGGDNLFNWDDGMSIFDGFSSQGGAMSALNDDDDEDLKDQTNNFSSISSQSRNANNKQILGASQFRRNADKADGLESKEAFGTQVYNNFDEDAFDAEFGGFEQSAIEDGLFIGF